MDTHAYQNALDGAVWYDENDYGRIRMTGETAADLLQRLSTNDMRRLRPGFGTRTVLTTPIGRIIDVLTVYTRDDGLVLITGPNQGGPVFSHLRKNIFFNDKVTLQPLGRSHAQLALYGPAAAEALAAVLNSDVASLPLHGSLQASFAGADVLVARAQPLGGQGFRALVPLEAAEQFRTALAAAGVVALDPATYETLRVEHGYPATGYELSQEYIPLETGLGDAISFTKGCYVGQEIIARMESRGRLAKVLRGLRLPEGIAPPAPAAPLKLDAEGKEAGDLTSVVDSPRFGPVALAYVRSAYAEPGTRLGLPGQPAMLEVVELPFG